MPDGPSLELLHALTRDTLSYLQDPLLPKQAIFANAQECMLFQRKNALASQTLPVREAIVKKSPDEVQASPVRDTSVKKRPDEVQSPPVREAIVKETVPPSTVPKQKISEQSAHDGSSQIKKTLLSIAPSIQLTDQVPDDAEAKKVGSAWKEKIPDIEVILLACERDDDTLSLLKSLGKAIDQHLGKAKIIPAERLEREKRWDLFLQKNTFRLIIASLGMQQCPELMRFYRVAPDTSQFFLDKTPLFPLVIASHYKVLEHKALLWTTLCQMLKK